MTTQSDPGRRGVLARSGRLAGLAVALVAAASMLILRPLAPPAPARTELPLAEAYPSLRPADVPATLADGAAYRPLFFLDAGGSVGTALSDDGRSIRLVLRQAGVERVLRLLPKEQEPDFGGFTTDGTRLVWLELTAGADGQGDSRIWIADLATAASRTLATDTGAVLLFDAEHDMVLHDDAVSWIANADSATARTEVRTVALTGGDVAVRTVDGAWSLAAWPWLVGADPVGLEPMQLSNMDTGEHRTVSAAANELISCSATWCRAIAVGSTDASTVIDVLRPDGSDRFGTVTGAVNSAVYDVAVLDRYEIYTRTGMANTELLVYDLTVRRAVVIGQGVGGVFTRNGMLWWSTGDNEAQRWHVLDLRALT
ncbi:hypothetical protein [Catellatospora tritici]|uniref:hypothetical protein n=1 Tax=Catellatospora tritici TaxID=2851566 RepID=UPI001C2D71D5|nr:hypothetical protein [Catellatospora tritici]MBV1856635.1 hypothetical protein [Catellatospora tritici]